MGGTIIKTRAQILREEGEAIGEARGRSESLVTLVRMIRKKIQKNLLLEEIAEILDMEECEIQDIYGLLVEFPDWTDKKIAETIVQRELPIN